MRIHTKIPDKVQPDTHTDCKNSIKNFNATKKG